MDSPLPLSRIAVIGLLSDHGWDQSHGTGEGFAVDVLDQARRLFRVRYRPPAGTSNAATIAAMAEPLRSAGWDAQFDGDTSAPHIVLSTAEVTPGQRSLAEETSVPYLAGRLVGLAVHLTGQLPGLPCCMYATKIAASGLPPVAGVIARLDGMVARELACRGSIPAAYRDAYADISTRLSAHAAWPSPPWSMDDQGAFMLAQHHQSAELTRAAPRDEPAW